MNNIIVVSMDNELSKQVAKHLAKELNLNYVDLNLVYEKELLSDVKKSVFNEDASTKEKNVVAHFSKEKDIVMAIENEMFLSNKNYELCKNNLSLLIETELRNDIEQNLQKLLKYYCKLCVKDKDLNKIITLIKG